MSRLSDNLYPQNLQWRCSKSDQFLHLYKMNFYQFWRVQEDRRTARGCHRRLWQGLQQAEHWTLPRGSILLSRTPDVDLFHVDILLLWGRLCSYRCPSMFKKSQIFQCNLYIRSFQRAIYREIRFLKFYSTVLTFFLIPPSFFWLLSPVFSFFPHNFTVLSLNFFFHF